MQRKKKTSGNMHCIMAFTKRSRQLKKPSSLNIIGSKSDENIDQKGDVEKYTYDINCNVP